MDGHPPALECRGPSLALLLPSRPVLSAWTMGQCHEAVATELGDYFLLFFILEWLIRCLVGSGETMSVAAKSATLLQFMTWLVYTSVMSDARHRRLAL